MRFLSSYSFKCMALDMVAGVCTVYGVWKYQLSNRSAFKSFEQNCSFKIAVILLSGDT